MKTTRHDNPVDCSELTRIMDEMIKHCQIAKAECRKDSPDIVVLCDNAIEEIGNLLGKAETCIYTFHGR